MFPAAAHAAAAGRRSTSTATRLDTGPKEELDAVANTVLALTPKPEAVGVAIPGEVNAEGRCWRLANVPGFEGVAIGEELSKRLNCPIAVENDATTAALGEQLYGHGREHASFVMVTLGTGIGGGVVLERRLHRGAHGFGGEIGHVPIDRSPDAPLCGCGLRGCVEAFAGTHALLARYRAAGGTANEIREIATAAHGGEERARHVFDEMGVALAWMLTSVQNVLDLDAVVFSGGISKSFDLIAPGLRRQLRARAHAKPLGEIPLLVRALGDRAGIVGAATLVRAGNAARFVV